MLTLNLTTKNKGQQFSLNKSVYLSLTLISKHRLPNMLAYKRKGGQSPPLTPPKLANINQHI